MNIFEVKANIDFQFSWVYDGLYSDDYVILANYINKNAQPWLQYIKSFGIEKALYRGVHNAPKYVYAFREQVRQDRRPKDSSLQQHQMMNAMIEAVGGTANRSNAIFTTFVRGNTIEYGETYAVIPLGNFHYTWSPVMGDWYEDVPAALRFSYFLRDDVNPVHAQVEKDYQRRLQALESALATDQNRGAAGEEQLDYLQDLITHHLSPKGRHEWWKTWSVSTIATVPRNVWDTLLQDPANYNTKKLSEFIKVDKGLKEASDTAHEVMLHCDQVLYVDSYLYNSLMDMINGKIDTESAKFQKYLDLDRNMLTQYYGHRMGPGRDRNDLEEGKLRNAALAGIATVGLASAINSPSKVQQPTDHIDKPAGFTHQLDRTVSSLWDKYGPRDEEEEEEEITPEITEEMEMRFLATAIARKYRINAELSFEIVELAHKHADEVFPQALDILALIAVESSFNPKAVSKLKRDPARGLMQVRPGIWGVDPKALNSVEKQIVVGVRILKKYYGRTGDAEGTFHAYNMGITNYRRGRTNPGYVAKIAAERDFLSSVLDSPKMASR